MLVVGWASQRVARFLRAAALQLKPGYLAIPTMPCIAAPPTQVPVRGRGPVRGASAAGRSRLRAALRRPQRARLCWRAPRRRRRLARRPAGDGAARSAASHGRGRAGPARAIAAARAQRRRPQRPPARRRRRGERRQQQGRQPSSDAGPGLGAMRRVRRGGAAAGGGAGGAAGAGEPVAALQTAPARGRACLGFLLQRLRRLPSLPLTRRFLRTLRGPRWSSARPLSAP
jgi:hypothetical protein